MRSEKLNFLEQNPLAVVIGFLYGLSLTVLGIALAGAGHGTYLLLGIASAPLSFFGVVASVVSPPILWATLWAFLAYAATKHRRTIVALALIAHYIGILLVAVYGDEYVDPKYITKVWDANPFMMVIGLGFYVLGQAAIWLFRVKTGKRIQSRVEL